MDRGVLWLCVVAFAASRTTSAPADSLVVEEMGKGLTRIPNGSPATRAINFAYNHLRALPAYVFSNNSYRNLQKIELYQNVITTVDVQAFRELRQLKIVDLSGNRLTAIEFNTFRHNHNLEKLDLSGNKIMFEPDRSFLQSTSIHTLILSDNSVAEIYEVTFSRMPNIRNLILDNNYIYHIFSGSFLPLAHIQYLSLSNTSVYRLDREMFSTLPKILDLCDTPLAGQFDPPLKKIRNEAVTVLMNIESRI